MKEEVEEERQEQQKQLTTGGTVTSPASLPFTQTPIDRETFISGVFTKVVTKRLCDI